ncbi:caspase domain-containing protein [Lactifluus volemus]|nr:caspase domain-containing protein [Lactifluus volemus]
MSTPFSQSQLAQPIATVPSNAGSWTSATGHLLPLSAMFKCVYWLSMTQGHRSRSHSHSSGHSRSRSNSLVPSPAPSLGYIPSPSPAPMEQGHHYRHAHILTLVIIIITITSLTRRTDIRAPILTDAPTTRLLRCRLTLLPDTNLIPMPPVPAKVPRGIPAPPRAAHVSQMSGSRARKPLVSQEVDAPERPRQDWRVIPCSDTHGARADGKRFVFVSLAKFLSSILNKNTGGDQLHRQQNALHGCPAPEIATNRKNMLNAMRWLVEDARPDDALFFHYSGHGGRTRDLNGDEVDGWDEGNAIHIQFPTSWLKKNEVIFPVDYKTAGIITDDLLHDSLVRPLPAGCRLTGVFDSCHSASILDLTFEFHSNGKARSISPVAPAYQQEKTTPADVISFSGCKDSQTSADVVQGGVAVGAMSYAFLKVLKRNPQITYIDLLRGVREILNKKYSQSRNCLPRTKSISIYSSLCRTSLMWSSCRLGVVELLTLDLV